MMRSLRGVILITWLAFVARGQEPSLAAPDYPPERSGYILPAIRGFPFERLHSDK